MKVGHKLYILLLTLQILCCELVLPFSVVFNKTNHCYIIHWNVHANQLMEAAEGRGYKQRVPFSPVANRATSVGVQLKRLASSRCKAERLSLNSC